MSSWYGEWFYYDGRKLCLGWPATQIRQTLYYGKHLEKLQMDMQVMAVDSIYTGYVSSQELVYDSRVIGCLIALAIFCLKSSPSCRALAFSEANTCQVWAP